jgi:phage FluMu protein Com
MAYIDTRNSFLKIQYNAPKGTPPLTLKSYPFTRDNEMYWDLDEKQNTHGDTMKQVRKYAALISYYQYCEARGYVRGRCPECKALIYTRVDKEYPERRETDVCYDCKAKAKPVWEQFFKNITLK